MGYQIWDFERLDEWRATHPEHRDTDRLLGWLFELVDDPVAVGGTPVPNIGLPVYTAIVPDTDIAVTYCVLHSPPYLVAAVVLLRVEDVA